MNHLWGYHLDMSPHSSYIIILWFFNLTCFTTILFKLALFFSYNSCLFSSHTLAWASVLHLKFTCFLYISVTSQQISIQLVLLFILCMLCKYSKYSIAILILEFLCLDFSKITRSFFMSALSSSGAVFYCKGRIF